MSDDTVLAALAAELERPAAELVPAARLADLGVDSLDFVRLVQAVEEAAGVRLDDKEAAAVETVGDLLALARRSAL